MSLAQRIAEEDETKKRLVISFLSRMRAGEGFLSLVGIIYDHFMVWTLNTLTQKRCMKSKSVLSYLLYNISASVASIIWKPSTFLLPSPCPGKTKLHHIHFVFENLRKTNLKKKQLILKQIFLAWKNTKDTPDFSHTLIYLHILRIHLCILYFPQNLLHEIGKLTNW